MAGVVGTKIPHYSVFGETVEIAGVMEESGEPMRIQVCKKILSALDFVHINLLFNLFPKISQETRNSLKIIGGFNLHKRESASPKLPEGTVTYWLIGLAGNGSNRNSSGFDENKRVEVQENGTKIAIDTGAEQMQFYGEL